MLSERRKLSENRPPEGAKPARGGSKMALGRPLDGSFVPVAPNLAARKPALEVLLGRFWRSWSRLGAFWAAPGASRAAPGRLLGVVLGLPGADLDDLDDVCGAT